MQDRSRIASLAALGSVVAASLCCLPVLPLALAAGGASAAWFTASRFQPYLLGLSAVCIAYGFWQAARVQACTRQRRMLNLCLLAVASFMTAGAIFFPQAIANFLTPGGSASSASANSGTQMPYVRITGANQFRDAFNLAPRDSTIVVAMFSPT